MSTMTYIKSHPFPKPERVWKGDCIDFPGRDFRSNFTKILPMLEEAEGVSNLLTLVPQPLRGNSECRNSHISGRSQSSEVTTAEIITHTNRAFKLQSSEWGLDCRTTGHDSVPQDLSSSFRTLASSQSLSGPRSFLFSNEEVKLGNL